MAYIHNHEVSGEFEGLQALKQLDNNEALVLFDYAKHHGRADFEGAVQGHRKDFTLVHNSDGTHAVEEREQKKSSGWF